MTPRISVVVPTRDRPRALARCLAALEAQSGTDLEIVVADDGSRDAAAIAAVVARAPRARLVHGCGRGPASARNAGAQAARAPLVCFTDDDCAPAPGWCAALAVALESGADAAAGLARAAAGGGPGAVAWQVICEHLTAASWDPASGRVEFAPSCTLACTAATARAMPFDEAYPLAAGEDRDWCARVIASGRALVLAPGAVVEHHHAPGARAFWRQHRNYGRGALHFRTAHARPPEPPAFYLRLLVRGLRRGPAVATYVLAAQVATVTGLLLGLVRRDWHPEPVDRRG